MRVCIVGASGKLGQYMVQQSLDRGDEVVGLCREQSVGKLDPFKGRITVIPGATDDREVIKRANRSVRPVTARRRLRRGSLVPRRGRALYATVLRARVARHSGLQTIQLP